MTNLVLWATFVVMTIGAVIFALRAASERRHPGLEFYLVKLLRSAMGSDTLPEYGFRRLGTTAPFTGGVLSTGQKLYYLQQLLEFVIPVEQDRAEMV